MLGLVSMSNKDRGFTLIELMVTVTIAMILVMLAAPSFNDLIQRNRMTSQANDLLSLFQYARSEAVKSGNDVAVIVQSESDAWRAEVRRDSDNDGNFNDEQKLREIDYTDSQVSLDPDADITITYNSLGRNASGSMVTVAIQHHNCKNKLRREIVIGATGRAQVNEKACILP